MYELSPFITDFLENFEDQKMQEAVSRLCLINNKTN